MSFNDGGGPGQPGQGQGEAPSQGDGGGGGAPYQEYLERIQDEEARSIAEEGFKSFDANTTKKFTEHAAYRKGWAPYEEMGLRDQDPQMVAWAMQLGQAAQADPRAFYDWVNSEYANQFNLGQPSQEEYGGYEDPNQQLIQRLEQLEQMYQSVDGRFQQQDQTRAQEEALRMVEGQISELEKKHGETFDRDALEMVLPSFVERAQSREELESAVPRAWEALQGLLNKREQQAFSGKLDAGRGPEASGMPDVSPPRDHTLKEAHARAMEMARRGGV